MRSRAEEPCKCIVKPAMWWKPLPPVLAALAIAVAPAMESAATRPVPVERKADRSERLGRPGRPELVRVKPVQEKEPLERKCLQTRTRGGPNDAPLQDERCLPGGRRARE